jgi:hypothetical protein
VLLKQGKKKQQVMDWWGWGILILSILGLLFIILIVIFIHRRHSRKLKQTLLTNQGLPVQRTSQHTPHFRFAQQITKEFIPSTVNNNQNVDQQVPNEECIKEGNQAYRECINSQTNFTSTVARQQHRSTCLELHRNFLQSCSSENENNENERIENGNSLNESTAKNFTTNTNKSLLPLADFYYSEIQSLLLGNPRLSASLRYLYLRFESSQILTELVSDLRKWMEVNGVMNEFTPFYNVLSSLISHSKDVKTQCDHVSMMFNRVFV